MRRFLGPVLVLVLPLLGCCFGDFARGVQEGFSGSFCAEYQRSFVETCTSTCVSSGGEAQRAQCASGCQTALTADATWIGQCGAGATPTTAPPPG